MTKNNAENEAFDFVYFCSVRSEASVEYPDVGFS